ncbi:MAG: hypothetical protein IPM42_17690 [Saprospiraceae bacterium]|nr:hypothetical protein [Saprospiraceae bacterium]
MDGLSSVEKQVVRQDALKKKLIESGQIRIGGSNHDISTGQVSFNSESIFV